MGSLGPWSHTNPIVLLKLLLLLKEVSNKWLNEKVVGNL